jgi:hypothetical protein
MDANGTFREIFTITTATVFGVPKVTMIGLIAFAANMEGCLRGLGMIILFDFTFAVSVA